MTSYDGTKYPGSLLGPATTEVRPDPNAAAAGDHDLDNKAIAPGGQVFLARRAHAHISAVRFAGERQHQPGLGSQSVD